MALTPEEQAELDAVSNATRSEEFDWSDTVPKYVNHEPKTSLERFKKKQCNYLRRKNKRI